jgi:hypothetical protein
MIDDIDEKAPDAGELFATGEFRIETVQRTPSWSASPWFLVVMIVVVCLAVSAWLFVVLPVLADLFFYSNAWLLSTSAP